MLCGWVILTTASRSFLISPAASSPVYCTWAIAPRPFGSILSQFSQICRNSLSKKMTCENGVLDGGSSRLVVRDLRSELWKLRPEFASEVAPALVSSHRTPRDPHYPLTFGASTLGDPGIFLAFWSGVTGSASLRHVAPGRLLAVSVLARSVHYQLSRLTIQKWIVSLVNEDLQVIAQE
jgi:hypothetical protein